jgi:hypothetical protein
MENHAILNNDAFDMHDDLKARAAHLCIEANNLYKDALDRGLSFYDARHYQVRAKEAKYFMSGNISDFMHFLKTRLGRMNQPTSDNILAMRIRQEILKVYPFLAPMIPAEEVQHAYLHCINEKMNLNTFPPDYLHLDAMAKKGILIGEDVKFSHDKSRDEYPHMGNFNKLFEEIINEQDT